MNSHKNHSKGYPAGHWDSTERVQSMVDSYAERYNKVFWNHLQSVLTRNKIGSMLEIGVGPGLFLRDFINTFKVDPKAVMGIDESEKMLTYAKQQLTQAGYHSVQLVNTRFNLDYLHNLNKKFDIIFMGLLLHELPSISELLESLQDILTPEGYLIIFEHVIVPLKDYMVEQKKTRGRTTHEIINRYPHPAKFHKEDIAFVLQKLNYEIVVSVDITNTVALIIGKNMNH